MTSDACAMLEFTTAPLPILRVSGVVDIGITTSDPPWTLLPAARGRLACQPTVSDPS